MKAREIEKCVWPAAGIRENTSIEDYDWGYLYFFEDGRLPEFSIVEKPTEKEIRERWGHYLSS